jgi:hypothetical protein
MYFSDGSEAQYRNRQNFINIFYHDQDFGLSAEWRFLVTIQKKGPLHGIGRTV